MCPRAHQSCRDVSGACRVPAAPPGLRRLSSLLSPRSSGHPDGTWTLLHNMTLCSIPTAGHSYCPHFTGEDTEPGPEDVPGTPRLVGSGPAHAPGRWCSLEPLAPGAVPTPTQTQQGNDALAQAAPRGSSLGCPEVSDEVELGVASGLGRGPPSTRRVPCSGHGPQRTDDRSSLGTRPGAEA